MADCGKKKGPATSRTYALLLLSSLSLLLSDCQPHGTGCRHVVSGLVLSKLARPGHETTHLILDRHDMIFIPGRVVLLGPISPMAPIGPLRHG